MNLIELNAILYYADYLSLQAISQPVTDNCKYFFIHSCPINSAYILDLEPIFDENSPYIIQAYQEYYAIKDKFGDEAVSSFIDDICFIRSCGMVDAKRMLGQIHMFSTKEERKIAYKQYNKWKSDRKHYRTTINEDGTERQIECTMYFKHAEEAFARRKLQKSA